MFHLSKWSLHKVIELLITTRAPTMELQNAKNHALYDTASTSVGRMSRIRTALRRQDKNASCLREDRPGVPCSASEQQNSARTHARCAPRSIRKGCIGSQVCIATAVDPKRQFFGLHKKSACEGIVCAALWISAVACAKSAAPPALRLLSTSEHVLQ
jgi:hypothetical protein